MTSKRLVVGAAILRDQCVLAARKQPGGAARACWEFPGGKVEPGEPPESALIREIEEELAVTVEVSGWLAATSTISAQLCLRVAIVRLGDGVPQALEHDELRWLNADELQSVDWCRADRPFLAELAAVLGSANP